MINHVSLACFELSFQHLDMLFYNKLSFALSQPPEEEKKKYGMACGTGVGKKQHLRPPAAL